MSNRRVDTLTAGKIVVESDKLVNRAGTSLVTAVISTDGTMAGNSDTEVPSEKAVKTYVDTTTLADNQTGKVIDPDGLVFSPDEMTASGVLPAVSHVQLNHASVKIEATVTPTIGQLLIVTQKDAGTAAHTLTTAGTFDGTNNTATFNAQNETLVLYGLSATRWAILENIGSVGLSAV